MISVTSIQFLYSFYLTFQEVPQQYWRCHVSSKSRHISYSIPEYMSFESIYHFLAVTTTVRTNLADVHISVLLSCCEKAFQLAFGIFHLSLGTDVIMKMYIYICIGYGGLYCTSLVMFSSWFKVFCSVKFRSGLYYVLYAADLNVLGIKHTI